VVEFFKGSRFQAGGSRRRGQYQGSELALQGVDTDSHNLK
jgi:hypothetical protein